MANGNLMHGFLNDMEMGETIDPSTIPDTIVEEVVAANNEVVESSKDLEALSAANTELIEINNEMDVALESNAGPAVMRLVLNRYANLKSKLGIPVSGLEADSKNLDVTADDVKNAKEESKGVFAKIGDFISKVWKAIKDGIAKVWAKMKEFWAWLTGKNKVAEKKIIKSEIAKAAVNVAADTNIDLENKEELSAAVEERVDKKEILKIFDNKEFDEMMADPTTVVSLDTLKAVRAEPEISKKKLAELMNNKIKNNFDDIAKQLMLVLPFCFTSSDRELLIEYKDTDISSLYNSIGGVQEGHISIAISKKIKEFIKQKTSSIKDIDSLLNLVSFSFVDMSYSLKNMVLAKKDEMIGLSNIITNKINSNELQKIKIFTVDYGYIISTEYLSGNDNRYAMILRSPSPLHSRPVRLDVYELIKNISMPKWKEETNVNYKDYFPVRNDNVLKEANEASSAITKNIDKLLKLIEAKQNVDNVSIAIAKEMAEMSSIFSNTLLRSFSKQSDLFSMVSDMLDTKEAIAELAKQ